MLAVADQRAPRLHRQHPGDQQHQRGRQQSTHGDGQPGKGQQIEAQEGLQAFPAVAGHLARGVTSAFAGLAEAGSRA